MMDLLMMTVFLLPLLGIFRDIGKAVSRMFKPPTPREILQMRQKSGGLSEEGWELLGQFKEQYGTPLTLIAPVLSSLDERLRFLSRPIPLASQRLAMLEETGAMEEELQRQARALQASGFRGGSLARALMGARLGTMMNRERMLADLALQEYMTQLQQQQMREQAEKERFNLLMALRSGLQEQAVKGGALSAESVLQAQQLASQQMMGLMQGIGSLAGAYAQYRQQQEMLRALQGLSQPQGAPASSASTAPPPQIIASAYRFFNPSRIIF
jgi:hypothetical protein